MEMQMGFRWFINLRNNMTRIIAILVFTLIIAISFSMCIFMFLNSPQK